ncbi:MAG: sodium/hydrogen antiporter [Mycobacterium sp.]|nr:sodium/hydrogen antiporter [Mycobacterium sp.]
MLWSVVGLAAVLIVWSLSSSLVRRWRITPVMVLVVAGALVGATTHDALATKLDTDVISPIIEMILAVVLFEHATNIKQGVFGGQARLALRLLLVALPVGLALTIASGLLFLPHLGWATLLVMACVLVPIDYAPVVSFLHDERIPLRMRQVFNVEEGYADGVISPVFVFALAIAVEGHSTSASIGHALSDGLPHLLVAIALGVGIGVGVAKVANLADARGLMTDQARRIVMIAAPVLTYTLNVGVHGNGFVAAFICGIAYNGVRTYQDATREQGLIDDLTFLLTAIVWFVFGAVAWYVLEDGVPLRVVFYSLVVLVVVRGVSVTISMVRSGLSRSERMLLVALGPRGTANIVLALLAYDVLADNPAERLLEATVLVVLGSVVLHGLLGEYLINRNARTDAETRATVS